MSGESMSILVVLRGGANSHAFIYSLHCVQPHISLPAIPGVCHVFQGELQVCSARHTRTHTISIAGDLSYSHKLTPSEPH